MRGKRNIIVFVDAGEAWGKDGGEAWGGEEKWKGEEGRAEMLDKGKLVILLRRGENR